MNSLRIFKSAALICLIVIMMSCQRKSLVDTIVSNDFSGFLIQDKSLKQPLQLSGEKQQGAVFFETPVQRVWLKGKPAKVSSSKDFFEGVWQIQNRKVIISFKLDSGKYKFSFHAQPDTDIMKWGFNIAATADEYFTGLFERVVDGEQTESWREGIQEALNIRGQKVQMSIKPTLSLYCPFFLSSNGYGLFIEGARQGCYDMCKTNPGLVSVEFEGASLNGIIYIDENPAKIVQAHSLHVGPTIIPPEWAFMPWRWRDKHTNSKIYYDKTPVTAPFNSMVVEDMLMMKAFDIPCGVYWVDRPWAKGIQGYEDFTWDTERFPNAEKMIRWIHGNDTRFLLWIAPWVVGNMKQEAERNGYTQPLIPRGGIDSTIAASLDFTNPEACRWWQQNGIEKMLKRGVDGFKLDRAEEEIPENSNFILHDGRTLRDVRNEYPVLYVKTVYESCKKIHGDDFMLIPRAGYTGSSRYAGFWGGDIAVPQEGLRAAIIALQRCAIIGFSVWGSDIGGYWKGKLDREVCARWLAFGCFNPVMEFGPTDDRAPWDMPSEPSYDTMLIATWRLYAKIHSSLSSYCYNLAKEANKTGMPIVRPLFLGYPDQKDAWNDWQTFMLGPDILVSAIWQKGKTMHKCYLPKGTEWRDAWDMTKVYKGGQYVEVETPFYKIPIFLRENSTLNLGDLNQLYRDSYERAKNKPNLTQLEQTIR